MRISNCGLRNINPSSSCRYSICNPTINSGHRKLIKVFDRDPFHFPLPMHSFAVINVERKLEMRIGLFESSDRFFDFDIHAYVFLDIVS